MWVCRNMCNWCSCKRVCGYVVYMYKCVHPLLLLPLAGSLSTYVYSFVLLCVGVDRCSISIKQRGVLYIYSICSSKHLSLVLCRYMSLFMRVCVRSIWLYMYVDARRCSRFVPQGAQLYVCSLGMCPSVYGICE